MEIDTQTMTRHQSFLMKASSSLAQEMGVANVDAIKVLVDNNALVFAKIILSFYRRVDDASKFFEQGRMSFF